MNAFTTWLVTSPAAGGLVVGTFLLVVGSVCAVLVRYFDL